MTKKKLEDFFGIISDQEGERIIYDLKEIEKEQKALLRKRFVSK